MYITRIEQGRGKRYKVYGEESFLFALYGKELKQYHIEENTELEDKVIAYLLEEIIEKRAKERALYLLEQKPYPIAQMITKLRENEYPDGVIEQVILFLKNYHYLDDEEYVKMYVEAYSDKKSKRQLTYDLASKGISQDIVNTYFLNNTEFSEVESIKRQLERYGKGKNLEDKAVRQKVFRYLYRKGFSASLIDATLNSYITD